MPNVCGGVRRSTAADGLGPLYIPRGCARGPFFPFVLDSLPLIYLASFPHIRLQLLRRLATLMHFSFLFTWGILQPKVIRLLGSQEGYGCLHATW